MRDSIINVRRESNLMAIFPIIVIEADLESKAVDAQDYCLERFEEKNLSENRKKKEIILATINERVALALRRSIGVGAKSFEVADKTSTGTIARAFPADAAWRIFVGDP